MEVPRDGEPMKGSRGSRPEPWGTPINNSCVEATATEAGRWAGRELFHAVLRALEEESGSKRWGGQQGSRIFRGQVRQGLRNLRRFCSQYAAY